GAVPRRIFDVQIAAGLVGYSYPLSLVNLAAQVLRIALSSSETRTDWRRRPLTTAQLRYALDDVRHLLDLADHLEAKLRQMGRSGAMAAAARPAPAQPPGTGDSAADGRMARRRGSKAKPALAASHAGRSA